MNSVANAWSALRTRISVQLYASRIVSLFAVALLAVASIHFAASTRTAADYLFSNGVAALRDSFALEMKFERHRRIVESAPAEFDRVRLRNSRAALDLINADIGGHFDAAGSRANGPRREAFLRLAAAGERVLHFAENFSQDRALEAAQGPYAEAAEAIDRDLESWRNARLAGADRELARLSEAADRLTFWVAAGAAVALLLIGPIGLLIKYRVLRRLNLLTSAMLRLARNETAVDVPFARSSDEVGDLARAVEIFKNNAIDLQQIHVHLDAALNNMSQGLCMFNRQETLVVCNDRFLDLYGLPPSSLAPGLPLGEVFDRIFPQGRFNAPKLQKLYDHYRQYRPRSGTHQYRFRSTDGRVIAVSQRAMPGGGWVDTNEDITHRVEAESQIAHMAHYDALTGLPNRFTFRSELDRMLAKGDGTRMALLCLDLDGFKNVNDTFGHAKGDDLLREVAGRLKRMLPRQPELVYRLGGDEFAILVPRLEEELTAVSDLARELISELSKPYGLDGHEALVGASIGIVIAPDHGTEADGLLKHADLAMYNAKAAGRGMFRYFEPEMRQRLLARQSLEHDLRLAIETDQLELHFQPTVQVPTGEISGFEALLRWRHPVRGMISPAEFIPIAEETGLIQRIGDWVLRQACLEAGKWPQSVRVAVNLSPVQFQNPNLVQEVFSALAQARLDPRRLELEITESVLLDQNRLVLDVLYALREFGVNIAMDDFGTGYSSLSYLRRFPFDKIKIDQAFIRAVHREQDAIPIVRAIIALGTSLGMAITAEGVETRDQLAVLQAEGCHEAQGYLFSAAVAPAKISELLNLGRFEVRSTAA